MLREEVAMCLSLQY